MADESKPKPDTFDDVEKSQAVLRASIEESKRLTEESQSLLDQQRKAVDE